MPEIRYCYCVSYRQEGIEGGQKFWGCSRFPVCKETSNVEWVIIDAAPINIVDLTALQQIDELGEELEARGMTPAAARVMRSMLRYFKPHWADTHREERRQYVFYTLKAAIRAFHKRGKRGVVAAGCCVGCATQSVSCCICFSPIG